ncbi:MAG: hypothetical protein Q8O89_04425, partial [Nanoarchaeota archaeon]|nr:hypothetical protein [Nanoarchaeota archaeon]
YAMNEAICRYYDLVDKIDKKKHIRNDLPEKMFEKPVATGLEGELQKFDVWNKGFSEETNEIVFTLMEKKGFDHAIIRQQVNVSDTYQKFMDFLSGKPQRSPYTLIEYFTNDVLDEDKRVNIIAMVNSKYKTVECDCSVPEYFLDKRQLLEFINSVPDVPHKRIQKDIDFLKYSLKLMINKRETLDNLLGNKLGKEIDKSKKQRPKNGSGDSEVA